MTVAPLVFYRSGPFTIYWVRVTMTVWLFGRQKFRNVESYISLTWSSVNNSQGLLLFQTCCIQLTLNVTEPVLNEAIRTHPFVLLSFQKCARLHSLLKIPIVRSGGAGSTVSVGNITEFLQWPAVWYSDLLFGTVTYCLVQWPTVWYSDLLFSGMWHSLCQELTRDSC